MREPCEIRRLAPGDAATFRALNAMFGVAFDDAETYGAAPPGDDRLEDLLAKPHVIALAGLADGEAVGGLVAYELDTSDDTLVGDDGGDVIHGHDGDDSISGGASHDAINGMAGDDTVAGGGGNDWVLGGKDNDLLEGGAGNDLVNGNLGDDHAAGGAGDDVVRGGQGDDVLSGGDGNDFLSGDRGNDTLAGGAGADTFNVFVGGGDDRIVDFNAAEGDRIHTEGDGPHTVAQVGVDVVIYLVDGATVTLEHTDLASLPEGWIFN